MTNPRREIIFSEAPGVIARDGQAHLRHQTKIETLCGQEPLREIRNSDCPIDACEECFEFLGDPRSPVP